VLVDVVERPERERRRHTCLGQQLAGELIVVHRAQAAVGVGQDRHRTGLEETLREHERAQRVVTRLGSGVAQDVGVAQLQAEGVLRVDAGVHARDDHEMTPGNCRRSDHDREE